MLSYWLGQASWLCVCGVRSGDRFPRVVDRSIAVANSVMSRLASKIEAILYLKGQPLLIADVARYAGCDRDAAAEGLIELMADYAHRDSALEVVETSKGYSLQLREAFQDMVETLIPLDLSVAQLRTLAAIALKGPLAQTELVNLRGSGAYQHVQELVRLGFVRKRRQSDGRSYWLQIANKFHQYFHINEIPQLIEKQVKTSAQPETGEALSPTPEASSLDGNSITTLQPSS